MLLESVQVLPLIYSDSLLELLSRYALNIQWLDMCQITAKYDALADFLGTNRRSIRSIGFHDVRTTRPNQRESRLSELYSDTPCRMPNVPHSMPCRTDDCGCLPFWKEGQRLISSRTHQNADDAYRITYGSFAEISSNAIRLFSQRFRRASHPRKGNGSCSMHDRKPQIL